MTIPKTHRKWRTRPLECWQKAKELRQRFYQDAATAREQGKTPVEGQPFVNAELLCGVGNFTTEFWTPLGASIAAASNEFSRQCINETQMRGYGCDTCGYVRNVWGAMFLNLHFLGGEFPRPDFVLEEGGSCDIQNKAGQVIAEHFGVPLFHTDLTGYFCPANAERDEIREEYWIGQTLDEIEWLEKVTGRKFDDEKFSETVKTGLRIRTLAGEVFTLNQNIPAPLDQKSMYSFFILGALVRSEQEETLRFWEMLRDEVKERVANHIAAVATERYRWIEEAPPPWYFLKYYRYMEKYGAVCVGSPYVQTIGCHWRWGEDGTYHPRENPLELGWPLNTREELIRAMFVVNRGRGGGVGRHGATPEATAERLLSMAKAFNADGAILPLWRSGIGYAFGMREVALKLTEAGIPTMHYEGSQPGDKTDFDEAQVLDRLDVFMESQGLRKLED